MKLWAEKIYKIKNFIKTNWTKKFKSLISSILVLNNFKSVRNKLIL